MRIRTTAREMFELYASKKIRPYVSARYPLDQAGQAITDLAERRAMGESGCDD